MTESKKNRFATNVMAAFLLCCLSIMLILSNKMMMGVRDALILCATTVIPSLFPFMIASELLIACHIAELPTPRWVNIICKQVFRVSATGLYAFLLGALCGFPIGAKFAADLYKSKQITLTETERLLCFCNNTGPAFIIAGIGGSLFCSRRFGIVLYAVQIIASLLCGIIFARFPVKKEIQMDRAVLAPSIKLCGPVDAVRNSVYNILSVCGFVVLFATVTRLVGAFIKNQLLLSFIYSLLEVGGAGKSAAELFSQFPRTSILAVTLAINFGGLSVHMQTASLLNGVPLSFSKYIAAKLTQAAFAVLLTYTLFPLILQTFT